MHSDHPAEHVECGLARYAHLGLLVWGFPGEEGPGKRNETWRGWRARSGCPNPSDVSGTRPVWEEITQCFPTRGCIVTGQFSNLIILPGLAGYTTFVRDPDFELPVTEFPLGCLCACFEAGGGRVNGLYQQRVLPVRAPSLISQG